MTSTMIQRMHWLTLAGYFGLMIGLYVWHLLINKTEAHLISIIIITQMGPLLFPLRGLLSGKVYTHAWSIYLAIFYFIVGIWYSGAEHTRLFGIYVTITSLMFMTGAIMYTRLSAKLNSANTQEKLQDHE